MSRSKALSAKVRIILGTLIVLFALLLLGGGLSIPFVYESFSILYKFGMEKTLLRSGKMVGITIALLVFFQVLLGSRFKIMERIFSVKRLFFLHRTNGMIIAFLIFLHPLLIKASESFTSYTLEKKYYPEFLGIALFGVLLLLSLTAIFKKYFRMPHGSWLLLHRSKATLAIILMPAHILFVSETFKSGLPHKAALAVLGLNLLLITRIWLQRFLQKA